MLGDEVELSGDSGEEMDGKDDGVPRAAGVKVGDGEC